MGMKNHIGKNNGTMNMNPLVSVIIPVYNVVPYLDRCLHSVREQTYTDLQIILVDDGSTDGSSAWCDNYVRIDERAMVIHQANGGLSAARNAGLSKAKGEYAIFIDSDDHIGPQHVEHLIRCSLQTGKPLIVTGGTTMYTDQIIDSEGNEQQNDIQTQWYPLERALEATVSLDLPFRSHAWGKLYAKELFPELHFPKGKLYEDQFTLYKVIYQAGGVQYESANDYYYTIDRPGSIVNANPRGKLDFLQAITEEWRFIAQHVPTVAPFVERRYTLALIDTYDTFVRSRERQHIDELFRLVCTNRHNALLHQPDLDRRTRLHYLMTLLGQKGYHRFLLSRR
ncbi:glycosyltransferase family 2 protein [Bifidobacterium catenulatum]|jgi:glycosyltransferase involved in cell wall biosynthesis|uniref:glycosyltransferase family 2 protein n=1 Tax=Bifidobacterium catenulatum TaxID=1686 RepID=UPI00255FB869|nr:glycosyltransferase family 2 protein [Bifidobacterium catenulatum]WJO87023.1 glycosyltransferase family 2 protein [Bifidobacterium catenulatum]